MEDPFLTKQHQHALLNVVRQMLLQLNNRQMDTDLPRTTTAGICNPATAQLKGLYEMLNILVGGIKILTNDEQRLNNESFQMPSTFSTLTEELLIVKLSIEESNALLEGAKHNQDSSSLPEKANNSQYVSYDGTLRQIIRLDICEWAGIEPDSLQRIAKVFKSLNHLVLVPKDSAILIDWIPLTLLKSWNSKELPSLSVAGSPSNEAKTNLRQWLIDNTHLLTEDSFGVEYQDDWFNLWL
ncbi:unnamed protein product [Rotaria sordida]|uniref:Uncharacterized protein n=1 Tax=Rotaria sordida TaxID=392033 RepID=A0A814E167_9BILA|nr:unnamed protein product [Rotaria sordida]